MNNEAIRILIADDHNLFRDGVKSMLNDNPEIFIVGEVANGIDLVKSYFDIVPDMMLVDIAMPGLNGIDAFKKIKKEEPDVKALFLSAHDEEEYIYYCLNAGGSGMLHKSVAKGELLFAIKKVAGGEKYYGAKWTEEKLKDLQNRYNVLQHTSKKGNYSLTPTEDKILLHVADGLTSQQIAEELNIGKRTVDFHRTQIMQKFNLKTLPELIKFAIQYQASKPKNT